MPSETIGTHKKTFAAHTARLLASEPFSTGVGSLLIVLPSIILLSQRCAQCRTASVVQGLVLPLVGIAFGLLMLASAVAPKVRLVISVANACLVLAGLISPLVLGTLLLGYHPCTYCIIVWFGVIALFAGMPLDESRASKLRLVWTCCAVLTLIVWGVPATNLEAKRLLIAAGLSTTATENGPTVGSVAPMEPSLPSTVTVVFWTQCPCPLPQLQEALRALNQKGVVPVIITTVRVPEMKAWAPRSSVLIVDDSVFQQWGVDRHQTHVVVRIEGGIVVTSNPASQVKSK